MYLRDEKLEASQTNANHTGCFCHIELTTMVYTTSASWAASSSSTRTPGAARVSAERVPDTASSVARVSIHNEDVPALSKQLEEARAPHPESALFNSPSHPTRERTAAIERRNLTASILSESRRPNGGPRNL